MVGPISGFQANTVTTATQPAAANPQQSGALQQQNQQQQDNVIQREPGAPVSNTQETSVSAQDRQGGQPVQQASAAESQPTSGGGRGSMVDISV